MSPNMPTGRTDRLRICIVTPDFTGPIKNGGVGTACTLLARALVAAGHFVEVLFTVPPEFAEGDLDAWCERYSEEGIRFSPLFEDTDGAARRAVFPDDGNVKTSHLVYLWLKRRFFDVVIFQDWRGNGYFALLAKKLGIAFSRTSLVTYAHGPSLWHLQHNGEFPADVADLRLAWLERQSLGLADVVVAPTNYLLGWIRDNGFPLPKRALRIPYLIPPEFFVRGKKGNGALTPARELVFFGRLEARKGLHIFCDAVERLLDAHPGELEVTFLGKFGITGGVGSAAYLLGRVADWPSRVRVKVMPTLGQREAIEYLKRGSRLAVICSTADNSPLTVLECIGYGIPFVATRAGGIPELVAEEFHATNLCEVSAPDLERALSTALVEGCPTPVLRHDPKAIAEEWLALIADLAAQAPRDNPVEQAAPLVSVCIATRNRKKLLARALQSLRAQTYANFETIVVDDGSDDASHVAFLRTLEFEYADLGVRLLLGERRFPGAARNHGVAQARGEYVLFMDDDNVALPHEIETLVRAARTSSADVVTCAYESFSSDDLPAIAGGTGSGLLNLPIGAAPDVALFENCVGDTNALFRRSSFLALGGFTEDYGLGYEDYELFVKAIRAGRNVYVVPEVLFAYRMNPASNNFQAPLGLNSLRVLRAVPAASLMLGEETKLYLAGLTRRDVPLAERWRGIRAIPELAEVAGWVADLAGLRKFVDVATKLGRYDIVAGVAESAAMSAQSNEEQRFALESFILAGEFDSCRRWIETWVATVSSDADKLELTADLVDLSILVERDVGQAVSTMRALDLAAAPPSEHLRAGLVELLGGDSHRGFLHFANVWQKFEVDYLERYLDIATAVPRGLFDNAYHHYIDHGLREKRTILDLRLPAFVARLDAPENVRARVLDALRATRMNPGEHLQACLNALLVGDVVPAVLGLGYLAQRSERDFAKDPEVTAKLGTREASDACGQSEGHEHDVMRVSEAMRLSLLHALGLDEGAASQHSALGNQARDAVVMSPRGAPPSTKSASSRTSSGTPESNGSADLWQKTIGRVLKSMGPPRRGS